MDWTANTSDQRLLDSFVENRDEGAFEQLVRRHEPMVRRVYMSILRQAEDAEDATQGVFWVLARKADGLKTEESVGPWLHRIAHGLAVNARKDREVRIARENRVKAMESPPSIPGVRPEDLERSALLHGELNRLPDRYRRAMILFHLEGHSLQETARIMGCPVSTAGNWLARGRECLRQRLSRRGWGLAGMAIAALLSAEKGAAELPSLSETPWTQAIGRSLGRMEPVPDALSPQAVFLAERTLKAMIYAKVKCALAAFLAISLLGSATRVLLWQAGAEDQASTGAPPPLKKDPDQPVKGSPEATIKDLASLVMGDRVLASFSRCPIPTGGAAGALPNQGPTDEARLAGQAKLHGEIVESLEKAGHKILHVVRSTVGQTRGLTYSALFLLENRGEVTVHGLAKHPAFAGGIVFKDGHYMEGLPYPEERLKEKWAPRWISPGAKPAPYAYFAWGTGDPTRKAKDKASFINIPDLKVEYTNPPPGSGGSLGQAKLTPTGRLTLVEVFLRTKAYFDLK